MADFFPAFERMIVNEGGYKLHDVPGDRGGMTYAGIARKKNPHWEGWDAIDRGETPSSSLVRDFYRAEFWDALRGDEIVDQEVAQTLFDFSVNAGLKTAVKLAQVVCGATPDGVLGPRTLAAVNATPAEMFKSRYALAKLARYRDIVTRDRTQLKFLLGWINRLLREAT